MRMNVIEYKPLMHLPRTQRKPCRFVEKAASPCPPDQPVKNARPSPSAMNLLKCIHRCDDVLKIPGYPLLDSANLTPSTPDGGCLDIPVHPLLPLLCKCDFAQSDAQSGALWLSMSARAVLTGTVVLLPYQLRPRDGVLQPFKAHHQSPPSLRR